MIFFYSGKKTRELRLRFFEVVQKPVFWSFYSGKKTSDFALLGGYWTFSLFWLWLTPFSGFWVVLGPFWPVFGRFLVVFDRFGSFEPLLSCFNPFWPPFELFWSILTPFGGRLGSFGVLRGVSYNLLKNLVIIFWFWSFSSICPVFDLNLWWFLSFFSCFSAYGVFTLLITLFFPLILHHN